jgi:hypothetical protein
MATCATSGAFATPSSRTGDRCVCAKNDHVCCLRGAPASLPRCDCPRLPARASCITQAGVAGQQPPPSPSRLAQATAPCNATPHYNSLPHNNTASCDHHQHYHHRPHHITTTTSLITPSLPLPPHNTTITTPVHAHGPGLAHGLEETLQQHPVRSDFRLVCPLLDVLSRLHTAQPARAGDDKEGGESD